MGKAIIEFECESFVEFLRLKEASNLPDEEWSYND